MKALLLAAGLGTRLKPITDVLPKCLAPINGTPLLAYWLDTLRHSQVKKTLINLHYHHEVVKKYLSHSKRADFFSTVYEPELLGTGGTLLKNKDFFGNDPVMLIHADNLSSFSADEFIRAHQARPKGCVMTMMTYESQEPSTCGIVELDQDGVVKAFHEKVKNPPGNQANAAVYIVEPEMFRFLESLKKEKIDWSTEVIPHFMGKIFTFHNALFHEDVGSLTRLLGVQTRWKYSSPQTDWAFPKECFDVDLFAKTLAQELTQGKRVALIEDGFLLEHEQKYREKKLDRSRHVIIFKNVGHGFSSFDFFNKTGFSSFACRASE